MFLSSTNGRLMLFKSASSSPIKHRKPLKESPIYFITTRLAKPSLISSISSSISSSFSSSKPSTSPPLPNSMDNQSLKVPPRKTYSPSMDKSLLSSAIYKLPLKFISNAKPIDIITGFTKHGNNFMVKNKKQNPKKPSNVIYLPVKYHSNGKPSKVIINKFTKNFQM
uniref:Uncharacterized protein n=2 Tax=Tetranychus urticae TaxID=32264 RepID=T1KLG5_TETUR